MSYESSPSTCAHLHHQHSSGSRLGSQMYRATAQLHTSMWDQCRVLLVRTRLGRSYRFYGACSAAALSPAFTRLLPFSLLSDFLDGGDLEREASDQSASCLEPHLICTLTKSLGDQHPQETTFDQTSGVSALLNRQYVCSTHEALESKHNIAEVHFFRGQSSETMTCLHPLLSCDCRSTVPTPASCSSEHETIISPNLEQNYPQLKAVDHIDAEDNTEFLPLVLSGTHEGYSSSELQVWDALDLYFSESFCDVQFNSLMGFGNDASTSYCEYVNVVDMTERNMPPSSLDKTGEADNDETPVDYATLNYDGSCFYLQTKPSDSDIECSSRSCNALGNERIDQQLPSIGLPDLMDIGSPGYSNELSRSPVKTKNIMLVLDLDETLVHSKLDRCGNFDFTLQVFWNMEDHTVYVRRRPNLEMFLDKVAQIFEVVIFTASERVYAEPLIDKLDPDRKLISRRFYRESCVFSDGSYTKDLTIFGVDLAKVAIIDNTPQVFQLQQDNGIPIKSWFDDPTDIELVELLPFLVTLVDVEDVRPIISKTFNSKLQQDQTR